VRGYETGLIALVATKIAANPKRENYGHQVRFVVNVSETGKLSHHILPYTKE